MTTAERLRRRQRIETTLVILMGLLVVVLTIHDSRERDQDRERFESCLIEQFTASSEAQVARGEIAAKQSEAISDVINGVATALAANDLETIETVLSQYQVDQDAIDAERKANPFKPFPSGKCES